MTNQDDLDLLWPDPLSLTHYRWRYSKTVAPNVIRCWMYVCAATANRKGRTVTAMRL